MRNVDMEREEQEGVWHISSVLVTAKPDHCESVRSAIQQIPSAELADVPGTDKIVATLEATSEREIAGALEQIQQLEGVLAASMVFHQTDTTDLNSIVISDQNDMQSEGTCS